MIFATQPKEKRHDEAIKSRPQTRPRATSPNAEQCGGIKPPDAPTEPGQPFEPIAEAEKIVAGYADGPRIEHAGAQALYRPSEDLVRLPKPERFLTREFYYATALYELPHSTGHARRLDRGLDSKLAPFGSRDYSREELVAEMGSAFLCAVTGISPPTIEQSPAYIAGWKKKLTHDHKLVVVAAGAGQRAADWILGHAKQESSDLAPAPQKLLDSIEFDLSGQ